MLTFTSFLLSAVKYGDYDAVLRCYTLEHGYQSFFFKNIYSSKSKKKAYLFPLNELEFTVPDFKSGKMPSISKVEWLNKNIDLQDQKLNSIRMFGAEFLDQVFRNENGSESIYAIISNFNERLCDKDYNAHLQLVFDVLGLQSIEENNNEKLDQTLQVLIELRNQARKAKNFELSDQIRDKLLAEGIELKDGRDGTTYVLN